jgi:putative Mn2+ efflux pump MntP
VLRAIAFVLPLGLDTFAVCAALGLAGLPRGRRLRMSGVMVAFEAGMPLIGLLAGRPLARLIGSSAGIVAIVLLAGLGVYLLREEDEHDIDRLTRGGVLAALALGASISLDELAIGFSFGLLRLPVAPVITLIAAQALVVSQLGLSLGARLSRRAREGAERLAGVALLVLAAVLLGERLL